MFEEQWVTDVERALSNASNLTKQQVDGTARSRSRPRLRRTRPAGSGGGHAQDSITEVATELEVEHHVVEPGDDFGAVLAAALDRGADLLMAAGGDGTLCDVANVAMDHDLPMVLVPAGTRNHFALDSG
jgi:predicted polyphosphate/ATP-dependent NAD kinase